MNGHRAKRLRRQIAATVDAPTSGYERLEMGAIRCVGLRRAYQALKKRWKEERHG